MTLARGAAIGALAVAVVVVAVLFLSMGGSHTYKLDFQNAGQLVKGDDVQVGGRRIGEVDTIDLTRNNLARITVEVQDGFAPLHEGTTATIRATSLSGIANRYIALAPGPNSNATLPDNSVLGTDHTTSIVDLDQLFNSLDPKTLKGLQRVVQGSAEQFGGKVDQQRANAAAHFFNPAISTTARLVNELNRDTSAFTGLIVQGARVVTAISERKQDLTDLVTNANTTADAIGDESSSFARTLQLLPPVMRRANTTFVNLRFTLDDLDTLVDASKPATRRLAPLLAQLRPLVSRARPTIADLRSAIHLPGPNNDLIDVARKTPRLGALSKVVFPRGIKTLKQSLANLQFIRPYTVDLVGWFRDFGEGAATYDANGHYARIQPIFNTFSVEDSAGSPNTLLLRPVAEGTRLDNLQKSTADLARCPGAATQIRPDNGNPFRDLLSGPTDCNPAGNLPGEYQAQTTR
jgi:phospholipid/cholesterol/gamma-HCH transport system substrate-binding protein